MRSVAAMTLFESAMVQKNANRSFAVMLKSRLTVGSVSLRMAPLIDVIFLLLIFFFISSQFRPIEDFLPLDIPKANAASNYVGVIEPFVINVSSYDDGCIVQFGRDEPFTVSAISVAEDLARILEPLQSVLSEQKRQLTDPVELVFADDVKWDYTAKIYNLLFGMGFKDITFRLNE